MTSKVLNLNNKLNMVKKKPLCGNCRYTRYCLHHWKVKHRVIHR